MLGTAQMVQCQLMSVSQIIAQEQLPVVDLLKVRSTGSAVVVVVSQEPSHPRGCYLVKYPNALPGRRMSVRICIWESGYKTDITRAPPNVS